MLLIGKPSFFYGPFFHGYDKSPEVSPSLAVLEWSNVSLGNLSAGGNVTSLGSLAIWCDGVMATMWGPRSIAKLVYNSNN